MHFTITIELDAMRLRQHVAGALEEIAAKLRNDRTMKEGRILDANGNGVGRWSFFDKALALSARHAEVGTIVERIQTTARLFARYVGSDAGEAAERSLHELVQRLAALAKADQ